MKEKVLKLAKFLGAFALARALTKNKVCILAYHGIWFSDGHFGNYLNMSPEKFAARMSWLKASQYRVQTLDYALKDLSNDVVQSDSVVITIDDGWYSTYAYMLPVLQEHGLPATVYVTTGSVDDQLPAYHLIIRAMFQISTASLVKIDKTSDLGLAFEGPIRSFNEAEETTNRLLPAFQILTKDKKRSLCSELAVQLGIDLEDWISSRQFSNMTWEELDEEARNGFDLQLHTHEHNTNLTEPTETIKDIKLHKEKLSSVARGDLRHFCYPNGNSSQALRNALEESGIYSATLTEPGLVSAGSDFLLLPRVLDGEKISQIEFEAELSGLLELKRSFLKIFC